MPESQLGAQAREGEASKLVALASHVSFSLFAARDEVGERRIFVMHGGLRGNAESICFGVNDGEGGVV